VVRHDQGGFAWIAGAAYRSNEQRTSTGKCGQICDGGYYPDNYMISKEYFSTSFLRNSLLQIDAADR